MQLEDFDTSMDLLRYSFLLEHDLELIAPNPYALSFPYL